MNEAATATSETASAALYSAAEAIEKTGDAVQQAPADAPVSDGGIDYQAEARDVVEFWRVLISSVGPELAEIYDTETCSRLAGALGPVMQKYQFDLARFGPELVLAAVALPLGVRTYGAVKAVQKRRIAEARKKTEAPGGPDAQQPVVDKTDPDSLHNRT